MLSLTRSDITLWTSASNFTLSLSSGAVAYHFDNLVFPCLFCRRKNLIILKFRLKRTSHNVSTKHNSDDLGGFALLAEEYLSQRRQFFSTIGILSRQNDIRHRLFVERFDCLKRCQTLHFEKKTARGTAGSWYPYPDNNFNFI